METQNDREEGSEKEIKIQPGTSRGQCLNSSGGPAESD